MTTDKYAEEFYPRVMVNVMDLEVRLSGKRTRIHCELHDDMEVGVDYAEFISHSEHTALAAAEREKAKGLADALEYYLPRIADWGCHHDDPSWCDENCGDYGKRARSALESYRGSKG